MKNKISCLIVDDEKNSREVLKKLLNRFADRLEVVGMAVDAEDAYQKMEKYFPELIFLDIQMPGGDGFSLLKRFDKVPCEVIFVTSFDQYAINAIRFNAADYLIKPIDTVELESAIQKVIDRIENDVKQQEILDTLLYNLDAQTKKISVHIGDKVKLIREDEILYIEGSGRYSLIVLANGNRYTTARTLKDFEDYFQENSRLLRISKSFIINTAEIREYSKGEPFSITLRNDQVFEVARRKKAEVLDKIRSR